MSDKQTGVEVYQAESLLCECPVQQKPLLDMEGSAIIKILPRTLPPQPVYQTFLPVFQGGSGNKTKCMCSASDARYINALAGKCGAMQYSLATQTHSVPQ